jgi:hypothetical protein
MNGPYLNAILVTRFIGLLLLTDSLTRCYVRVPALHTRVDAYKSPLWLRYIPLTLSTLLLAEKIAFNYQL